MLKNRKIKLLIEINSFFFSCNKLFLLLIGKKYLLDIDTKVIHRIKNMNKKCIKDVRNKEYLTKYRCGIYETYDFFYKHCDQCYKT